MSELPNDVPNHSFLAEELLIPHANKTDGSRANMVCSHFSQLLILDHAELPLVFTNFENQIGHYSTGLKRAKEDFEVLKVFLFNDFRALIFLKTASGKLDVIEWKAATNLTEYYGYTSELHPEMLEVGAKIPKDTVISHNGMYDELGNLQFGVNLKTVYLPYKGKTYEDPIVISESAAKKLTHPSVHVYKVVLNTNDVLVLPIPAIGEEIKDGLLTNRRRISNNTVLDDFKNNDFNREQPGDTPFFAEGTITNIEVFCNTPDDLEFPYNAQFKEIAESQTKIYTDIIKFLNSKTVKSLKLTDDVLYWKRKALEYVDPEIKFTYDRREFEGIVVHVEVTENSESVCGSKLTGRYGNKGVISIILPDHEMPVTSDGEYAEVVCNSLGVVGR